MSRHTEELRYNKSKLGSKPDWLIRERNILPHSCEEISVSEGIFKHFFFTFCFVYAYPFNGYRELNSFEEPCLTRAKTVTFIDRKINPSGMGEHILPSTDRLFRCITSLQCGYTYEILDLINVQRWWLKIIWIENLWDDSFNSLGVLDVVLLIYKYIKFSDRVIISVIYLVENSTDSQFAIMNLFQLATTRQLASSDSSNKMDEEIIIIITKSRHQHIYPWPSFTTPPHCW